MRAIVLLFTTLLLLQSVYAVETVDPEYQADLDTALKTNPPGDYNLPVTRPFPLIKSFSKSNRGANPLSVFDLGLLKAVEPSDKDIKTLSSEAASYFLQGRWDLASKRYKQTLLLEPDKLESKANLLDILMLQFMYESDADQTDINQKYDKLKALLSNDILPKQK